MSKTPTTLVKDGHTVTSTYAPEIVSLRAQGYKEPKAAAKAPARETGTTDAPGAPGAGEQPAEGSTAKRSK